MKKDITTQTLLSTDTGRSMVEMLGTLAIMGVLSIGGIAGYRYAMDKPDIGMRWINTARTRRWMS